MYQYPYQNPYQPFQQKQEVVKVNGMAGANAYQLPACSSAILLDMQNPIVYLIATDGAGLKTVTPYTISEYKAEETSEYKALADRITRLEEAFKNEPYVEQNRTKRRAEYDEFIDKFEKGQS